jgi:pullulanase/glycogen debranching enzyme
MAPGQSRPAGNSRKGARLDPGTGTLTVTVCSKNASRIEVWLYDRPTGADEVERVPLARSVGTDGVWSAAVPPEVLRKHDFVGAIYYGIRAWGPNWPFVSAWSKGTEIGFAADVDEAGNRFNPNKLLIDPYAVEISHDPAPRLSFIDPNEYVDDYDSGQGFRAIDTGRIAPKSVLPLRAVDAPTGPKPDRPLSDDVIYEVHVRGLTKKDPSIPESLRGTFRGAGIKAGYLRDLGVTAIELLPVHQFASEQNDDGDPRGDNYWGYMTLGFFAPNRRYASDRSPGGPIREFKDMVRAFHEVGLKVFLDVVYNHTGEGLLARTTEGDDSRADDAKQLADRARILSFRGLDNATYYTLRSRPDLDRGRPNQRYQDNSGCGPSLNVAKGVVQDFILDSLGYWAGEMGIDDWTNLDAFLRARDAGDAQALAQLRKEDDVRTYEFAREMIRFRAAHACLRPRRYYTGTRPPGGEIKDVAWYGADGREMGQGWNNPDRGFLAFRVADSALSIYVACCWRDAPLTIMLPTNLGGARWRRVADTAEWLEPLGNVDRDATVIDGPYGMHERSVAIFVEH